MPLTNSKYLYSMTVYYDYINKVRRRYMKINSKLILAVGVFSLILTPKVLGYGTSSDSPDCEKTTPTAPWLYKAASGSTGSVDLTWHDVNNAEAWTVAYGTQPGKYVYGMADFGNSSSRSITISYLPSGTYYFVVRANNGCAIGPFSNEAKVQVSSGTGGAKLIVNKPASDTTPVATIRPSASPKSGASLSPSPKASQSPAGLPTKLDSEESAGKLSFWQRLSNFFRGLFGK